MVGAYHADQDLAQACQEIFSYKKLLGLLEKPEPVT
jgi:hypothetical protein